MLRWRWVRVPGDTRGAVLWKLASGVAIAGVMLVLLEIGLRLAWGYADSRTSVITSLGNRNDPSAKHIVLPTRIVEELGSSQRFGVQSNVLTYPDSRFLFHVRPNPTGQPVYCYEGIDDRGFRTGGSLEKRLRARTGAVRVLLLGDSCAFGWDICRFEDTIGPQLEHLLSSDRQSAEVINLSQPGYSTAQGVLLFRRWFPKVRPDFVVLYFGWNDLFPTLGMTDPEILRLMPIAASPLAQGMMKTAIYRTLSWVVTPSLFGARAPRDAASATPRVRVPLDESVTNMREIIDTSNAAGARVLIVAPAHGSQFRHRELHIDVFNRAVAASLRGDATLVRVPAMEAGDDNAAKYFNGDGFHPNARGALYIADAVAAAIIRQPSRRLAETVEVEPPGEKEALQPDVAPPTAAPAAEPPA